MIEMTKVEVFVSSTCPHCPGAIQVVKEAEQEVPDLDVKICNVEDLENRDKAIEYGIMAVPTIVIDNKVSFVGAPSLPELLASLQ
ncbi:thioredoxin [Methanobrevibacter sp. 87.7]|nr:thioredoxin [Methanobrevibacter sp. 87.7]